MWTTRIYSVAICQVGKGGLQEAKTKGFRNFWEELKGDRLDLVLLLFLYTLQVNLSFLSESFGLVSASICYLHIL